MPLALSQGMMLVTGRPASARATLSKEADKPSDGVPQAIGQLLPQTGNLPSVSHGATSLWQRAAVSIVAPKRTTDWQGAARALLSSSTHMDKPLRQDAPDWWKAPPEAVAAANHFDSRRENLQRDAREVLQLITPRAVSGGAHHEDRRCVAAFERNLVAVRRNRYVAPDVRRTVEQHVVATKKQSLFDVYRSIWAPRAPWSDGKDVYDTTEVLRKRFEVDFDNLLKLGMVKHIVKHNRMSAMEDGEADVHKCSDALWRHYSLCVGLFTFYAGMVGEINFLTLNAWTMLLEDCKLTDNHSELCKKANMDMIFIMVDKAEHTSEGKEKRHAGSHTDRQKALSRVEYLATLIYIATNKYVLTGKEPRVSSALQRMIGVDMQRNAPPHAVIDSDSFRREYAYTAEVTAVLVKHQHTLRTIFAGLANISLDWKGEKITLASWLALLQSSGMVGADLAIREAVLSFASARMAVIDGRSRAGEVKESVLPFEGFMEAICRIALLKALPTDDELAESGDAHAGLYLATLSDGDPGDYSAFIAERACSWGEKPDLIQPVHRCVEHTIAVFVHRLRETAGEDASVDIGIRERTMNKLANALKRTPGGR